MPTRPDANPKQAARQKARENMIDPNMRQAVALEETADILRAIHEQMVIRNARQAN